MGTTTITPTPTPTPPPVGTDPSNGRSRIFKHPLVIAAAILVAGALLWKVLPRNAAHTTLHWNFGNQRLDLDVQKDMSDPQALIQKVMSQQYSKAGTLQLLSKDGIYSITDPAIIQALQALCPDQRAAGGSLLQQQKHFQACNSNPIVKQLRDLASQHQAPFQYFGVAVEIGTPADTQPNPGQANVCENGGFLGHQIEIDTLDGQRNIDVKATGSYTCTGYSIVPDIQLSTQDALRLFGRPTRKLEKALAVLM